MKSITLLQSCCIYFAVALQSCCSDTANIYAARLQHICSGAATHMQCDCKKYAELCRRFLADEKDFSEENLERLGIVQRFENLDMGKCTNEIMLYIQKNLCYNNNKETGSI